jgi:hypothetical protein
VSGAIKKKAREEQRPVLFVNIGWGDRYDGGPIAGNHTYLREHGDDCGETYAYLKRDGRYRCGVGRGALEVDRLDVVFVARRGGTGAPRVVLLYLDADVVRPQDGSEWRDASTRRAYLFPPHHRPRVPHWPGQMSMRRWAYRAGSRGTEHGPLFALYKRVRDMALTGQIARLAPIDGASDEVLEAFEGETRRQFVLHRTRERALRFAKLRERFEEVGCLSCEVPGCGFDFEAAYGELGAAYAEVHHLKPLARLRGRTKTTLDDLAVVCANCHAMIHRGGNSRSLDEVRPRRRRKSR